MERFYISEKTGQKYPSVTTILSKFEDKKYLKAWQDANPDHVELSKMYSSIGTQVHSCNESLLKTGVVDFSKCSEEYVEEIKTRHEAYLPFLSRIKPIAIEEKLIWERFDGIVFSGFGGTTDLIGILDDPVILEKIGREEPVTFVSDYKNWASVKQPDMCIKHYCQLAAYAAAKNETLAPSEKVQCGFLLGTTYSKSQNKSNLYIYYLDLEHLDFYFGWFYKFMRGYFNLVPRSTIRWSEFKELACGYFKEGEDETGKAIWGKRERNYLGTVLKF